jgi:hypothetical protein
MSRATIIDQLLENGIKIEEMKKFENLVRYYRNNDWQSDYSFSEIQVVKAHDFGTIVLVKDYTNAHEASTYVSNLFLITIDRSIIHARRQVFVGGYWKAPKEWEINSITEKSDSFLVEGRPFGKEVLKKSEAFFLACPLREEWENFFKKGGD